MRVVADTNILISALVFGRTPGRLLELARERRIVLITSEPLLDEAARVLALKFRWTSDRVASAIEQLRALAEITTPAQGVFACLEDSDDNRVLEAAQSGLAKCIVGGDGHLLRMVSFGSVPILPLSDFLPRCVQ